MYIAIHVLGSSTRISHKISISRVIKDLLKNYTDNSDLACQRADFFRILFFSDFRTRKHTTLIEKWPMTWYRHIKDFTEKNSRKLVWNRLAFYLSLFWKPLISLWNHQISTFFSVKIKNPREWTTIAHIKQWDFQILLQLNFICQIFILLNIKPAKHVKHMHVVCEHGFRQNFSHTFPSNQNPRQPRQYH